MKGRLAVALSLALALGAAAEQREQRTEAELLAAEPEVLLDGASFPERTAHDPRFRAPRRTFHVDAEASATGDGSAERPWTDLQSALCRLQPGDRLVVAPRRYTGSFRIAGACRDGTPDLPIQLFAQDAFLLPAGNRDVLTVERAHWQLWHVQIALGHSSASGLVLRGKGAHHVDVDHAHISEGSGAALRVVAGASQIVVSNSHIHHSGGLAVERAVRVRLVNNHIHHNRAGGVTVADAREIALTGNRIHNDAGPAVELAAASAVTVSGNRLWNCSLSAILLRGGSRDVTIERNSIVEATVAVDAREAASVAMRRNYFENTLTRPSIALRVARARDLRFHNNAVNGYTAPLSAAPSAARVSFANNLLFASANGWAPAPQNVFSFIGHNIIREAPLARRDLGRIEGVNTVDAGKAVAGEAFRGPAPDIGVAER